MSAYSILIMRIAILIVRILLGLIFVVFGFNGFLHFIPQPPFPPGDASTFATIMAAHGWMGFVSFLQIVGGLLLLAGRYVPLGLVVLGPIVVNILLFHLLLLGGSGVGAGLACALFEIFLIYAYRRSFRGLFDAHPEIA